MAAQTRPSTPPTSAPARTRRGRGLRDGAPGFFVGCNGWSHHLPAECARLPSAVAESIALAADRLRAAWSLHTRPSCRVVEGKQTNAAILNCHVLLLARTTAIGIYQDIVTDIQMNCLYDLSQSCICGFLWLHPTVAASSLRIKSPASGKIQNVVGVLRSDNEVWAPKPGLNTLCEEPAQDRCHS